MNHESTGVADQVTVNEIRFQVSGTTVQKAIKHYVRDELGIDKQFMQDLIEKRIDLLLEKHIVDVKDVIGKTAFSVLGKKKDYWGKLTKLGDEEARTYIYKMFKEIVTEYCMTNINATLQVNLKKDA